ncbi:DNA polymerase delta catalytic subunit [Folsomia candida]|uniref:DNA polymerase delta catalytic subunit n=1 Tax=Folsomia candida TaxID=158441 RepID=A0A226E1X5_FOLCA|nr:DNA polymerase delta catalytic subunit [Folsomia candida]
MSKWQKKPMGPPPKGTSSSSWVKKQNGDNPAKKPRIADDDEDMDDMEGDDNMEFDEDMDMGPIDPESQDNGELNDDEVETNVDLEALYEQWGRPPIKEWDPKKKNLPFQQMVLDHYISSKPIPGMPGAKMGPVPVIRMYGVTEDGHAICCHVHGFSPYFYVSVPEQFTSRHCGEFKQSLNQALLKDMRSSKDNVTEAVLMVELVYKINIYGYRGENKSPFAKITLAVPRLIAAAKRLLEKGEVFIPSLAGSCNYQAFESNLDFESRFMVDRNVVGCNWVELPAGKYFVRNKELANVNTPGGNANVTTLCQIEVDVAFDALISHSTEGEWGKVAPFRILSFDIECAGRKGIFPEPDKDPVIQIANMVVRQGETEPFVRMIFTLDTCAPIIGSQVMCYESEDQLLKAWAEFVRRVDPDILTGYNINNFDLWYLINRATHLKATSFHFLGRVKTIKSVARDVVLQSKQMGRRENKSINIEGRIIFDLLLVLVRDYKLRSYTLNSVSFHFLGEQKEDVHHSIITDLQNGNAHTRRRLAVYCLKDALLPLRLLDKLMCVINYMEMARVTGVPLHYLLTRGQQIKVVSQLLRKVINNLTRKFHKYNLVKICEHILGEFNC